jgi:hypothetical protein
MTDNNEFRVKHVRRSSLEPSDWLLTPEGKPLRARYLPYTPGDDPQVLQLLGYQPPRPSAPVIRVDRGIQTRGFHAGETMAGKILAAGRELRSGYPDYFELGTCLSYSTEPGSFAEIDEWIELRLVESDQVARWVRTQEAYDAQLDERLGIDTDDHAEDFHTGWPDHDSDIWVLDGELNGQVVNEPIRCCHAGISHNRRAYRCPDGTFVYSCDRIDSWRPAVDGDPQEWPTLDYSRIVVIGGLLDDAQVQFVIADRKTGPGDEVRWDAQNLAGDRVGTFWEGFDRIDDWVRWVPVASPHWPTAQRIMILAGRIGVNQVKTAQVAERVDYKPGDPEPETYPRYRVTHGTHRGAVLWEGGSAVGSYVVLEEGTKPVAPAARPAWPTEEKIFVRSGRLDGFDVQDLIGTRIDHPSGERVTSYPRYALHDLDGDYVGELWRDQPEDVDQIRDWAPYRVYEDATEWPTAKRIQVLAGMIDNERIAAPVVAERVDWHENAFSAQECFPKYQIVQGTAPVGATDVFYRSYDSDRITRYVVLEEDGDD